MSLTPTLSKLAEEYIVKRFVKTAVLARTDCHQFGTVPKSSTIQALISMTHAWLNNTGGNSAKAGRPFRFSKNVQLDRPQYAPKETC